VLMIFQFQFEKCSQISNIQTFSFEALAQTHTLCQPFLMCFQMNEVLNVADLATQTIATGNAATDASLTSVNTAITNIVNKLNEILKKSTNSC